MNDLHVLQGNVVLNISPVSVEIHIFEKPLDHFTKTNKIPAMSSGIKRTIKNLGGTGAVARACGANASTVSQWINRGAIPSKWWPKLMSRANELGVQITLEDLIDADGDDEIKPSLMAAE